MTASKTYQNTLSTVNFSVWRDNITLYGHEAWLLQEYTVHVSQTHNSVTLWPKNVLIYAY